MFLHKGDYNMAKSYSKNTLKPLTIEQGEELRVYKGFKLNSLEVMKEGFKILKALMPSLGTGIDQLSNDDGFSAPNTFGAMFQLLNENLTEEQFTVLVDKLLGSLICNSETIEDWVEHFDKYPQDLIEVISWTGKENFHDFFMESTMLRSKLKSLVQLVDPKVVNTINDLLNGKEQDTKESD